jgi:hypothetical protein
MFDASTATPSPSRTLEQQDALDNGARGETIRSKNVCHPAFPQRFVELSLAQSNSKRS